MEKRRSEQLAALYAGIAELYEKKLSDKQIAEKLGCAPETVFRWRKRNGKPVLRYTSPNKKLNEVRARELYDRGLSDSEIGEIMGAPRSTVATWRLRAFLPCNTKKKKAARKLSPIAAVNAEARRRGMTYGQYAAALYEEQKRAEELKKSKRKEG